ncbi:hypothetical protein MBLNU230_g1460t1 [Neophaeotheca triangularis]
MAKLEQGWTAANQIPDMHNRLRGLMTDAALLQRALDVGKTYGEEVQQMILDVAENVAASAAKRTSTLQAEEAASNKRKLQEEIDSFNVEPPSKAAKTEYEAPVVFWCKDVSFAMPARKKLKLEFLSGDSIASQSIRAINQQTQQVDFSIPVEDIEQTFCLPVPEKAARQHNFVIYPKESSTASEPFVFTLGEIPIKEDAISTAGGDVSGRYDKVVAAELSQLLAHQNKSLISPRDEDFASAIPQPHRKNETAYHVKAHRGSKDGYLFFLSNGILFGFKKPLAFYPFSAIQSISYTSVLQRTFNLVISVQKPNPSSTSASNNGETNAADLQIQEHEYSMLDQADFAGIDDYIKRHGLNDASMAEQRRAKAYNVNKVKGQEADGADGEEGGELRKAAAAIEGQEEGAEMEEEEEEEDEEGEDYDPGSEGESEGSGSEDSEGEGEGYEEVDGDEELDEDEEHEAEPGIVKR